MAASDTASVPLRHIPPQPTPHSRCARSRRYKCIKQIALSDGFLIEGSKILGSVLVGDILLVMEGPKENPDSKVPGGLSLGAF